MAVTTYTELRAAVANWLARDDLSDRIPEFIALAEAKFNRELRHPRMEKRSYTSVDTDTDEPEFITLPSNFQTMRRIRLSGVTGKPGLEFVTATQAETLRYGLANVTAQPAYYTIIDDEIELIPTPGQEYELEMVYRANIPALASNSTNWLLTIAPDAYLYGALLEAAPYMKDDARISVWALGFSNAIDSLNRLGAEVAFASGPNAVLLEGPCP